LSSARQELVQACLTIGTFVVLINNQ